MNALSAGTAVLLVLRFFGGVDGGVIVCTSRASGGLGDWGKSGYVGTMRLRDHRGLCFLLNYFNAPGGTEGQIEGSILDSSCTLLATADQPWDHLDEDNILKLNQS